jgi:hypothetical protein
MVSRRFVFAFGLLVSILLVANGLRAQQCSNKMTAGRYLVICDGYMQPAPNAPLLPAKGLSVATSDRYGNINGAGTVNLGAMVVQQTVSGTQTPQPDCTGTVTYNQTINGNPGPPIDITFVVSQHGDRINGLVTDPGAVFACELTRISEK